MIKNIFFDLDGTLLNMDVKEFLRIYYEEIEKKAKLENIQNISEIVDSGIQAMYQNDGKVTNKKAFFDDQNTYHLEGFFTDFYINEFLKTKEACSASLSIYNSLMNLKDKGYRLFLLTNPIFPQIATYERIRWAGLYPGLFEHITTYENSHFTKPNKEYFLEVINKFSLNKEEILMVGNDALEDLVIEELGIKAFIRTDTLINSKNVPFNPTYQGNLSKLSEFLDKLPKLDLCWCGSNKPYIECHHKYDIKANEYKNRGIGIPSHNMIKNEKQIEGIRKAGIINTAVLDYVEANIKLGLKTEDINQMVYQKTLELGGIPAPLHYEGFPKSVCTSVNEQVCHGIPSKRVILKNGDIINVDCTTIVDGYFADASRTFIIGNPTKEAKRLVRVAHECLDLAVSLVKPYMRLGDISGIITEHAHKNGYSVVRECTGHGVGLLFHEEPDVVHYGRRHTGMLITPGMVFTIEPMINAGTREVFLDSDNEWTIYTDDYSLSAQFEYTVLVTDKGLEILSK